MSGPAPPRFVVFDLGGVVIRICRSWPEACALAGVEVRGEGSMAEVSLRGERAALTDDYMVGAIPCEEYWRRIAGATGGLYDASEVERVHRAWVIDDYPGAAELVGELNALGVRTACLSNTNHSHWQDFGVRPGASAAVSAIGVKLVSHELGLIKPDPAIYARAERELGAEPGEVVFFDDLPENVDAASARGWRAVLIDHAGDPPAQARRALRSMGVAV